MVKYVLEGGRHCYGGYAGNVRIETENEGIINAMLMACVENNVSDEYTIECHNPDGTRRTCGYDHAGKKVCQW